MRAASECLPAVSTGPLRVRCVPCEVSWQEPMPLDPGWERTASFFPGPFPCPVCRRATGETEDARADE